MSQEIQEVLLTAAGKKELEDELEYLKVQGREEIKEKIKVALSFGDLSENSEYDEARNDQGKLEARISEIEATLQRVRIVDEESLSTDIVQFGSKVIITDVEYGDEYVYQIINSSGASNSAGVDIISDESPVAKAILGHRAGEIVDVECPAGVIKYMIKEIVR